MQAQNSVSIIVFIKYRMKQGLMIDRVIGAQREACLGGKGLDHNDLAEDACKNCQEVSMGDPREP